MWRDATLVAGKDLRIEMRSRVLLMQVAPIAACVVLLFGFALGPDRDRLVPAAPGLFWVAVLFVGLLAVQRSFTVESGEAQRDSLRLSGLDPAGVFLGKASAVWAELAVLEALLGAGVVVLFGAQVHSAPELVLSGLIGAAGLAGAGVVYGALSAGLRVRETLLPLLLLPVLAPVVLAGTEVWTAALGQRTISGTSGGAWFAVLGAFSAVYLGLGVLCYGVLSEAA